MSYRNYFQAGSSRNAHCRWRYPRRCPQADRMATRTHKCELSGGEMASRFGDEHNRYLSRSWHLQYNWDKTLLRIISKLSIMLPQIYDYSHFLLIHCNCQCSQDSLKFMSCVFKCRRKPALWRALLRMHVLPWTHVPGRTYALWHPLYATTGKKMWIISNYWAIFIIASFQYNFCWVLSMIGPVIQLTSTGTHLRFENIKPYKSLLCRQYFCRIECINFWKIIIIKIFNDWLPARATNGDFRYN